MTLPLLQQTPPLWRSVLRQNITKLQDLISILELTDEQVQALDNRPDFSLNLPRRLADKMAKARLDDPLFLQFVPLKEERIEHPQFVIDPVQDASFMLESKLLKKYEARALILTTSACAMHCRFCFRKNFNYATEDKTFEKELAIIRNDPSIEEVLLSGGDPLSLSDEALQRLFDNLSNIAHVRRIRFHTRFPIGIPERIDSSFLHVLKSTSKQVWFMVSVNHINEFDLDVWHALKEVQKLGIPVMSQTVLLKGVNDSHATLHALFQGLVDHGIIPYYLHQLDEVQGSSHFKVPIEEGKALIATLQKTLSGYGIPKYVQEIAGKPSKTPLA